MSANFYLFIPMLLHPEFKKATRQFWRQLEMFRVFLLHPELEVVVSYDQDAIQYLNLYRDYCAVDLRAKPMVMFQAEVIDTYSVEKVEELLGRFSFKAGNEAYQATLGL
ncbi:MAG: hypothetical protein HC810_05535 [Acaryochloridaceae cyanobacterium RL_2_7]|nr:hypothetical protein [Acaryochloridaceae cyanobacterium RL_2_7]